MARMRSQVAKILKFNFMSYLLHSPHHADSNHSQAHETVLLSDVEGRRISIQEMAPPEEDGSRVCTWERH